MTDREYYRWLLKNNPPDIKGDLYNINNFLPEKNSKRIKFNSRGNVINEANDISKDLVPGLPVNKRVGFTEALMVKAIQNGLVILINYAGDKDNWRGGRERVIYPMVLGVNRNTGNMLVRGWHLTGWSVSKQRIIKKEWRLFKTENIKSMMFTGDFYRLPPKGYKMNDRVMTERTIKSADFNEIRRNQDKLVNEGVITQVEKREIGEPEKSNVIMKIDARTTDTILDLTNPFNNQYVKDFKPFNKIDQLKLTFLKNINKNEYIAIIGALGTINRTVKIFDNKVFIGNFKVIKTSDGKEINRIKYIQGQKEFALYIFNKVI